MKLKIILSVVTVLGMYAEADWKSAGDALRSAHGLDGDHFGYSVDIGKVYAVVGAPDEPKTGVVYIFKKGSNDEWIQMQALSSPEMSSENYHAVSFGASVAIAEAPKGKATNPNLIVVGAPDSYLHLVEQQTDYVTGAICTYKYVPLALVLWKQQGECIPGKMANSRFGYSVAISNWLNFLTPKANIIVGNPEVDSGGLSNSGSITFYEYNDVGDNWNKTHTVLSPTKKSEDRFGTAVALYRDIAIVGASGYDSDFISDIGKAYFYDATDSTLLDSYEPGKKSGSNYQFGISVDISGQYAIVGEVQEDENGGAAYILKEDSGNWSLNTILRGSTIDSVNDGFGKSVTINSKHAVVGAPTRNTTRLSKGGGTIVTYTGAAYLYDNNGGDVWNEEAHYHGSSSMLSPSFFGQSVSLDNDTLLVSAHGDELVQSYEYFEPKTFNPAIIMYLLN